MAQQTRWQRPSRGHPRQRDLNHGLQRLLTPLPGLPSIFLGALLFLFIAGCSFLPFRVEGERPFLSESGPQRKTVAVKEPPNRLVAVDGTVCIVSGDKFESVKVDEKVWCGWETRGSASTPETPALERASTQRAPPLPINAPGSGSPRPPTPPVRHAERPPVPVR